MAYFTGELIRTQKGKVVYGRQKHNFRWTDARRIVRSLEVPLGDRDTAAAIAVAIVSLQTVGAELPESAQKDAASVVRELVRLAGQPQYQDFGGGEFGGGGATRKFGDGRLRYGPLRTG